MMQNSLFLFESNPAGPSYFNISDLATAINVIPAMHIKLTLCIL